MARKKEYCYKAIIHCDDYNDDYILYIGCPCGLYHVFATNRNHTMNYSIYGGYKNLGNASIKLIQTAQNYNNRQIDYFYTTKELLLKNGAFGM